MSSPANPAPGDAQEPVPKRVEIVTHAVDLRPHAFQSAVVLDERSVALQFWGGVAPCYVVGRVSAQEGPDAITITLFTGRDPRAGSVACIELAQYQEVVVSLPSPLAGRTVVDGAPA